MTWLSKHVIVDNLRVDLLLGPVEVLLHERWSADPDLGHLLVPGLLGRVGRLELPELLHETCLVQLRVLLIHCYLRVVDE